MAKPQVPAALQEIGRCVAQLHRRGKEWLLLWLDVAWL